MEIKPYSKWLPSVILNFQNLQFRSFNLSLNVILLLFPNFALLRVMLKCSGKTFYFDVVAVHHFEFGKFWIYVSWTCSEQKCANRWNWIFSVCCLGDITSVSIWFCYRSYFASARH